MKIDSWENFRFFQPFFLTNLLLLKFLDLFDLVFDLLFFELFGDILEWSLYYCGRIDVMFSWDLQLAVFLFQILKLLLNILFLLLLCHIGKLTFKHGPFYDLMFQISFVLFLLFYFLFPILLRINSFLPLFNKISSHLNLFILVFLFFNFFFLLFLLTKTLSLFFLDLLNWCRIPFFLSLVFWNLFEIMFG